MALLEDSKNPKRIAFPFLQNGFKNPAHNFLKGA